MVNQEGKDQNSLLKPVESLLADRGIQVESGVAQTDGDGRFTLILQKYTGESIYLEEGEVHCSRAGCSENAPHDYTITDGPNSSTTAAPYQSATPSCQARYG